jgi:predicted acylesterase/phospholipase RssA
VFVLGGGGALGGYQAGAVLGLAEAGILPDAVYACSAGALNGAFLAADPTVETAARLAAWWLDGSGRHVLMPSWWARARGMASALTTRTDGLLDPGPLRRLVSAHVPAHDISELSIPMSVTTTCLDCGAAAHHTRGSVTDVLAASCALPGLFPPVPLDGGHLHVDGGVVCGVPLAPALRDAGPHDRIFVLDCALAPVAMRASECASEPNATTACGLPVPGRVSPYTAPVESSRGALDVVLRAFTVARAVANRSAVAAAMQDDRVAVVPHVPDAWAVGLLQRLPAGPRDFGATASLVQAGRAVIQQWLVAADTPALKAD